ncbi:endonuclease/exonuclease/phosphatase family protein [Bifidobacterium avesanii]|uniref:Endonuclease/exonuclease/phosphatase family protein n=1 Tax=Bifidobacterium avesanii TaxID=1798157 RepID=A0A7K3TGJ2_9BIFI|nr:endonuclease/exonuclease/phosphatase family protein [Bifidobacterium avesanii]KAB8294356.1 endonuclease [Bifidobacterium avesanii]NEG77809.1 endonuclease/exonuclease/phosphatase family protein [Bifidobacterium avesanii]
MVTTVWVLAFVCMLWVLLIRLPAGSEAHMPMPYMIALVPFMWIPLLAVAVWSAAVQAWAPMCLCLAWLTVACDSAIEYRMAKLPKWMAQPTPALKLPVGPSTEPMENAFRAARKAIEEAAEAGHAEDRRVMTLNCRYGRADAAAIVDAVRGRNIDVLALQECNDALVGRLNEAGLGAVMPYMQQGEGKATDNGGFNVLFTREEPVGRQLSAANIPAADVPAMTLMIAGREVTFASAHPKSPMRGCPDWSAGIIGLSVLAQEAIAEDHDVAVVMGDLNSQIEHPSFRMLLASGFRDASLTVANGRHTTFPSWLPWPRIELDHVLFTPGALPVDVESFVVPGTDHLALTATLRF